MTELICDADGIRLSPDVVLAERRGAMIVPHHAHDIFRRLAPEFGVDLDWLRLNFAVGWAARFLTEGRLDAARKAAETVRLPQPLVKFNPNHYGRGPKGGQFAPAAGDTDEREQVATAGAPRAVRSDDRLSYADIRKLAHDNNRSKQDESVILAIAWAESSFNPKAINSRTHARGLMGVERRALEDVQAHDPTFPAHPDMFDPATNIRAGSAYLQILVHRWGSLSAGLQHYGPRAIYPDKILAAAKAIRENPSGAMSALRRILHP